MTILIDTTPLLNQSAVRGIGRYTRELVKAIRQLNDPEITVVTSDEGYQGTVDLVHYPFFDFFFATLPLIKRHPTIVTIHDVIPLIFKTHYPPGIRGRVKFLYQQMALKSVAHIVTDSECSKRDILSYLRVKPDRVSAVALAVSPEMTKPPQAFIDETRKKYGLPKRYIVYVGDINYSKNIPFLLRVVSRIPSIALVLVGKQMCNTTIPEGKMIEKTMQELDIASRVYRLCDVTSTQELCALYAGGSVYVQPSLYEGFGLPVLEAMQCKVPVVSSRGGSLPEVVGDAALLFHPHDEDEARRQIMKVLRFSSTERSAMLKKGIARAFEFSWENTAKQTISLYKKLGNKSTI